MINHIVINCRKKRFKKEKKPHDGTNQEINYYLTWNTGVCFAILLGGQTTGQLVKHGAIYTMTATVHRYWYGKTSRGVYRDQNCRNKNKHSNFVKITWHDWIWEMHGNAVNLLPSLSVRQSHGVQITADNGGTCKSVYVTVKSWVEKKGLGELNIIEFWLYILKLANVVTF